MEARDMVLTTGNDVKPPETPLVATIKQLDPQKGVARCSLPAKYSIFAVVEDSQWANI